MKQDSICALWADMSERSKPPTRQDRAANAARMRKGLPEVRHTVQARYEKIFDHWCVTLTSAGVVLRECRFQHDHTLEEMFRRGRGMACLEEKQAVEHGMAAGLGIIDLHLDSEQMGALAQPL